MRCLLLMIETVNIYFKDYVWEGCLKTQTHYSIYLIFFTISVRLDSEMSVNNDRNSKYILQGLCLGRMSNNQSRPTYSDITFGIT